MKGIFVCDPHSPGIFLIFQLGWIPPGMNILVKMPLHYTFMRYCFWDTERKNLCVYVNSVSNNLNIALQRSFSMAFGMALHGKSGIISQTTVNFNYFFSVKKMLEEGLLEHDHITLNTTIYCVTKQLIDNWNFIYELTTIVFHKLSCKP